MKTSIAMPSPSNTRPDGPRTSETISHDPDEYVCEECGSEASFGYGVSLLHERRGRWFCSRHRPKGEPNAWIARPGEDGTT
jgi:hypothetical protein